MGIGNEEADCLAKEAIGWRGKGTGLSRRKYHWIPQLISANKRRIKSGIRGKWDQKWSKSETGVQCRKRYSPTIDQKVNRAYEGTSKALHQSLCNYAQRKLV
jgi:hypothetical protein